MIYKPLSAVSSGILIGTSRICSASVGARSQRCEIRRAVAWHARCKALGVTLRSTFVWSLSASFLIACSDDLPSGDAGTGAGGDGGEATTSSASGGSGQGGSTGGMSGTGGGTPEGTPMFVAQGHLGRTTVSCDGGHTWVANRSSDDAARCWEPPNSLPDCDHDPGAGRGITHGEGWFVATYGWGPPGGVERSSDGVTWESVVTGTTFGGVAHDGAGTFVAAGNTPQRSTDGGATWNALAYAGLGFPIRRFAYVSHDGGRWIIVADGNGGREIAVSADAGDSWSYPAIPSGCGAAVQTDGGIAYGNGVIVIVGGDGVACRSSDGGDSWTTTTFASNVSSHLLWTGSQFVVWSPGQMHASLDGESWTSTHTTPSLSIGPAAVSDDGVFVAVRGGWQVWYEEQAFYRSDDGINWETLPSGSFVGSHPIRDIAFGYVDADCPSQ